MNHYLTDRHRTNNFIKCTLSQNVLMAILAQRIQSDVVPYVTKKQSPADITELRMIAVRLINFFVDLLPLAHIA